MNAWPEDTLRRITGKDDLHVAPLREDGVTHGTPTWIWSVRVGDELYVRAYNGQASRWYQAALRQRAGRITADGEDFDVAFEDAGDALGDRIDDAYRAKYSGNPYLDSMVSQRARAATVKIVPA